MCLGCVSMKTRTDERKLSDRIGIKPESRVVVSMTELSQLEYQPQRSAKKTTSALQLCCKSKTNSIALVNT